ncbi:hypothetical protein DFH06DRAFT_1133315 [Mycena polygramma]|nr:hypothetical protein DFH06DRAFT_1133315 [Mycena polygramma]
MSAPTTVYGQRYTPIMPALHPRCWPAAIPVLPPLYPLQLLLLYWYCHPPKRNEARAERRACEEEGEGWERKGTRATIAAWVKHGNASDVLEVVEWRVLSNFGLYTCVVLEFLHTDKFNPIPSADDVAENTAQAGTRLNRAQRLAEYHDGSRPSSTSSSVLPSRSLSTTCYFSSARHMRACPHSSYSLAPAPTLPSTNLRTQPGACWGPHFWIGREEYTSKMTQIAKRYTSTICEIAEPKHYLEFSFELAQFPDTEKHDEGPPLQKSTQRPPGLQLNGRDFPLQARARLIEHKDGRKWKASAHVKPVLLGAREVACAERFNRCCFRLGHGMFEDSRETRWGGVVDGERNGQDRGDHNERFDRDVFCECRGDDGQWCFTNGTNGGHSSGRTYLIVRVHTSWGE